MGFRSIYTNTKSLYKTPNITFKSQINWGMDISQIFDSLIKENEDEEIDDILRKILDPDINRELRNLFFEGIEVSDPEILKIAKQIENKRIARKLNTKINILSDKLEGSYTSGYLRGLPTIESPQGIIHPVYNGLSSNSQKQAALSFGIIDPLGLAILYGAYKVIQKAVEKKYEHDQDNYSAQRLTPPLNLEKLEQDKSKADVNFVKYKMFDYAAYDQTSYKGLFGVLAYCMKLVPHHHERFTDLLPAILSFHESKETHNPYEYAFSNYAEKKGMISDFKIKHKLRLYPKENQKAINHYKNFNFYKKFPPEVEQLLNNPDFENYKEFIYTYGRSTDFRTLIKDKSSSDLKIILKQLTDNQNRSKATFANFVMKPNAFTNLSGGFPRKEHVKSLWDTVMLSLIDEMLLSPQNKFGNVNQRESFDVHEAIMDTCNDLESLYPGDEVSDKNARTKLLLASIDYWCKHHLREITLNEINKFNLIDEAAKDKNTPHLIRNILKQSDIRPDYKILAIRYMNNSKFQNLIINKSEKEINAALGYCFIDEIQEISKIRSDVFSATYPNKLANFGNNVDTAVIGLLPNIMNERFGKLQSELINVANKLSNLEKVTKALTVFNVAMLGLLEFYNLIAWYGTGHLIIGTHNLPSDNLASSTLNSGFNALFGYGIPLDPSLSHKAFEMSDWIDKMPGNPIGHISYSSNFVTSRFLMKSISSSAAQYLSSGKTLDADNFADIVKKEIFKAGLAAAGFSIADGALDISGFVVPDDFDKMSNLLKQNKTTNFSDPESGINLIFHEFQSLLDLPLTETDKIQKLNYIENKIWTYYTVYNIIIEDLIKRRQIKNKK